MVLGKRRLYAREHEAQGIFVEVEEVHILHNQSDSVSHDLPVLTLRELMKPLALGMCSVCLSSNSFDAADPIHNPFAPSRVVAFLNKTSRISEASLPSKAAPFKWEIVRRDSFSWKSSIDVAISKIRTNGILSCQELLRVRLRHRSQYRYQRISLSNLKTSINSANTDPSRASLS